MKPTVTVLVHRERQMSHAVAGSCCASAHSTLAAARTAAALYFGVTEHRVTVEPITVGDGSAVVEATLQPMRRAIAWDLLFWSLFAFCVVVWMAVLLWIGGAK